VSALRTIAPFAAILGVLYAGGYAAGTVIDADSGRADGHGMVKTETTADPHGGGHDEQATAADALRLIVDDSAFAAGRTKPLAFRIEDGRGETVRDFDTEHARRMHVIVVRSDLSGFQHIHPRQASGGDWTVPLTLREPGTYRVFADFSTRGESATLSAHIDVPGDPNPRVVPHPSDTATVDGYEVTLSEHDGDARFTVRRGGRVVDDIAPYLGARGHLVALRQGDLKYLHVHPKDDATAGRDISFGIEYPAKGTYRLFLQFKHGGEVHTAAFTRQGGGTDGHGH
jgi:hypothetical protein